MRPARLLLAVALLVLPACSGLSAPEPQGPLTGDRLVEALRDGGLVLYLRHTETTENGVDDPRVPGRCEVERALTEAGRQDAREIGGAFDALDIDVGAVVASPYCRTVETAELAFGEARTDRALLPLDAVEPDELEKAQDAGRRLLAAAPPDGTVSVLVGHISNVRPLTGAQAEEGGTLVFRPDGDGGFRLVAEVAPQGWQRLAASR